MKTARGMKLLCAAAVALSLTILAGCGGGGGGSATSGTTTRATGKGKVAAQVVLTGRTADREADATATGTVSVSITITGYYGPDGAEFPAVTSSAVFDLSQGSGHVTIIEVPIGVNHLLTAQATWEGGATETIMCIIPEVAEGQTIQTRADQASTAVANAVLSYAAENGKTLAQVSPELIVQYQEAVTALAGSGMPYNEITLAAIEAYLNNPNVPPPTPTSITLAPATATVVTGRTRSFTAAVLDAQGAPIDSATVTFTVNPAGAGTVSSAGVFTAAATGTAVLTASLDNLSATAAITIIEYCTTNTDCEEGDLATNDSCEYTGGGTPVCVNLPCTPACSITSIDPLVTGCDDNNPLTDDSCQNPGTCNAACSHFLCPVICLNNTQCDDSNPLTIDTCQSPGICDAMCTHTPCNVECGSDPECDDSDPLTLDVCSNPGTCTASCGYTPMACAADPDCDDADGGTIDTCWLPGTADAVCGHSTIVSANISSDETWTLAGSPYILTQQIAIDTGVTLTIEPGVTLYFVAPTDLYSDLLGSGNGDHGAIRVDGTLIANGDAGKPITMTIDPESMNIMPGAWLGIYFSPAGTGSIQYVNMEYPSYAISVDRVNSAVPAPSLASINITEAGGPAPMSSYHFFVNTADGWREVGELHYGMQFTTKSIDLSRWLPDANGEFRVRIQQTGLHAAHIDAVSLSLDGRNATPLTALDFSSGEDATLKMLGLDNDVIDAHEKWFDVLFDVPAGAAPRTAALSLTAREEGDKVMDMGRPFFYPGAMAAPQFNMNTAAYHKYKLGGNSGMLSVDGRPSAGELPSPEFVTFTRPQSGHPDGYTYGYLKNDGRYLYGALDFTPDNTFDGDADYAVLHIRAGGAVKSFRVSVPEQEWGSVGFTYTDMASYQHKYYEFRIPLSEIGNPRPGDEISYVFEAYGTASAFSGIITLLGDAYNSGSSFSLSDIVIDYSLSALNTIDGLNISFAVDPTTISNVTVNNTNATGMYSWNSQGVQVSGLTIIPDSNYSGTTGMQLTNVFDSSFFGIEASGAQNRNLSLDGSYNVSFSDCVFNNTAFCGADSAVLNGGSSATFNNCDFSFNRGNGIYLSGDSYMQVMSSRITANSFKGINFYGNTGGTSDISNTNITDNLLQAIYNDLASVVNLDNVYMSGNYLAPGVEGSTAIPDSSTSPQQYIGISSIITQAVTPRSVQYNSTGSAAGCF